MALKSTDRLHNFDTMDFTKHQREEEVVYPCILHILAQHRDSRPSHRVCTAAQLQDSNHPQNVILRLHPRWTHCQAVTLVLD